MISKFEYSVTTRADRKLVWDVFSNHRRWHTFSNVYGIIHWKHGEPWSVRSRLEIEILQPVRAIIDRAITSCEPGKKVGWIDHGLGLTIEQWVEFLSLPRAGTRIVTWGESVGKVDQIEGFSVRELFPNFIRTWYENLRAVCNEMTTA